MKHIQKFTILLVIITIDIIGLPLLVIHFALGAFLGNLKTCRDICISILTDLNDLPEGK